jgi:hypothetical protein
MTNFNCGTDNFGLVYATGDAIPGGVITVVHAVPPGGGRPACSDQEDDAPMKTWVSRGRPHAAARGMALSTTSA